MSRRAVLLAPCPRSSSQQPIRDPGRLAYGAIEREVERFMPSKQQESDAWRLAATSRSAAASNATPAALVHVPLVTPRVARGTFLAGLGAVLTAAIIGALDFVWPRRVRTLGELVLAGNVAEVPAGGAPILFQNTLQFWLVNLDPADVADNGGGGGSGILALWRKCPHLGCAVPWEERVRIPVRGSDERAW